MNAIPEDFFDLIDSYNAPRLSELRGALLAEPSVSLRLNRSKGATAVEGAERVAWNADGVYLAERRRFTFDPSLHQGLYYVQDASSMFTGHVVGQLTADGVSRLVLDACAAPGGKTTAAVSALPAGSVVVANEYDPKRCSVLRENVAKWGNELVAVTQGDACRFGRLTPSTFDIVLADVPCSGEGMMRKDAVAAKQWSRGLIAQCAARQREIVDSLWEAVRPGGYLVYSTCTFNRDENELMADYIADRHGGESVEIAIGADWGIMGGIDTCHHCYRFTPGQVRGEGLFMAVFRKPEVDGECRVAGRKERVRNDKGGKGRKVADECCATAGGWLAAAGAVIERSGDEVSARFDTRESMRLPEELRPRLHLGTVKGRDVVPSQELALSLALKRGAFDEFEVEASVALDYLRAQALRLPEGAPRGIVLLTYGGLPLGFAKNLGSRANNLYPRQWRVLAGGEPCGRIVSRKSGDGAAAEKD